MKTINVTLKINECELTRFESWLRHSLDVVDLRVVPDTEELYKTDKTFKKLVKKYKDAREQKNIYINEHN